MTELFRLEWRLWRRSRGMASLLVLTGVLLVAAAWWSAATDRRQRAAWHEATAQARADWLGQGAANPHGMAHFGDFVFRPSGPLARIDSGVQASLGQVLRVEGHKQGSPLHRPASSAGSIGRFGRFDPAFVLQVLIPLVLLLVGATATAADRRSGRLRLLLVQGGTGRQVATARILALWSLGAVALALVVGASFLGDPGGVATVDPLRLAGLIAAYVAFYGVVATSIVLVSFAAREASRALSVLLAAWVIGTAVLPRVTATLVDEALPLPTRDAFQTAMKEARSRGMDGHNSKDARIEKLEQEVLAKHGVASVDELPINFDGITMQIDEEVGNAVWDEHYGRLHDLFVEQRRLAQFAAFVNPFQAIEGVSMSFAGTDLAHDLEFQAQVERYRRELVQSLNHEHAYGGSKTGDWSWKADAEFYAGLEAFDYESPAIEIAWRVRVLEIGALVGWGVFAFLLAMFAARRVETGDAA